MLVQHTGEVPDTLPVTEEARERLREQANQLGAATVVRLIDLLHVAVEDMRQGGDPRLLLELALVKVTRPGSDLSLESLAFRMERLEQAAARPAAGSAKPRAGPAEPAAGPTPARTTRRRAAPLLPLRAAGGRRRRALELEQLQEAWRRSVLPARRAERSIPAAAMLRGGASRRALDGDELTLEFPPRRAFHREKAEEPKNAPTCQEALYEVTGRRLELAFATGEPPAAAGADAEQPATEQEIVELVKSTFDAQELEQLDKPRASGLLQPVARRHNGAVFSPSVENLVAQLTRLPGVGQRTAQRLAFHILQRPPEEALALAAALDRGEGARPLLPRVRQPDRGGDVRDLPRRAGATTRRSASSSSPSTSSRSSGRTSTTASTTSSAARSARSTASTRPTCGSTS